MAAKELHGLHEVRVERRRPPHPGCPRALLPAAAAAAPRSLLGGARLAITGALLESWDLAWLVQTLLLEVAVAIVPRRHVEA